MNKKFFIAWLVVFLVWFGGSFLVHGLLLHDDYGQLPNMFRTDADSQQYFPYMLLAHILLSGSLVWLYQRGVEDKPWVGQGVRFGIAVALLATVPMYLVYYAVQPMPGMMVVKQIVYDTILTLILGVVTALLCRQSKPA
ncbi:MAG TPA: hypothetical protein VET48_06875 [Steroidobacteraceae bacterium]|nr:hypothetical protein [Steroidobacteraceae bacterium]